MIKNLLLPFIILFFSFPGVAQDRQFSTQLPLVFIDTHGKHIPDEPKIMAHMGIIWNEDGEKNSTNGVFNHYDGNIAIELRGSSSQGFPKKSYGFETRDEAGEDIDFPLLGLPPEEDWIFYGPYSDKSLIRNALTFSLAKSLDVYSSRIRFVELFLNNQYQGVYVLMEKIKRDKVRLDIAKLNPEEITGEDLTGGYILKIDKSTGSGGDGWSSRYINSNNQPTFYQYEVPADDVIVAEQMKYIQDYVTAFEDAIYQRKFTGEGNYRDYTDIYSFIDYTLVNELTKNIDGYRLSTFLHKDKNGKLKAGPIWDFNLAIGNADYFDGWVTSGFQIDVRQPHDNWATPFWWKGMWADTAYVNAMKCRWESLRTDSWSDRRINELTDSLVYALGDAVERNFQRWPVMGKKLWPNWFVAGTYSDEIRWMKSWLSNRTKWLDMALPGKCGGEFFIKPRELSVTVYPTSVQSEINLKIRTPDRKNLRILLYNVSGMLVYEEKFYVTEGEQTHKINAGFLPTGIYFYHIFDGYESFEKGKILKR